MKKSVKAVVVISIMIDESDDMIHMTTLIICQILTNKNMALACFACLGGVKTKYLINKKLNPDSRFVVSSQNPFFFVISSGYMYQTRAPTN